MLLLISYDLKQPDRDYSSLYDTIKNAGSSWWHYLESVWIIKTDMSVDCCSNLLLRNMDTNDLLFVVDITGKKSQGWLPSKAWEWLKSQDINNSKG